MTDPGFTVSPADLHGFAAQIADTGTFYSDVGARAYETSFSYSLVPVPMQGGGQLCGVLSMFADDFIRYVEAAKGASTRLAGGFAVTQEGLDQVAGAYERQEETVKGLLAEAGPSEENQAIDDAIQEGEPNFDWRARLDSDVFADIDLAPPVMTYDGPFRELNTALSVVGNLPLTVDALIQELFGISILKGITEPLLGNWGFLYVMRDICAAEANAYETASNALNSGVTTLTDTGSWTGPGADAFGGHVEALRQPIAVHVATLRTASTAFDGIADIIDKAGNDMAALIAEVINAAIAAFLQAAKEIPKAVGSILDTFDALAWGGGIATALDKGPWAIIKRALGPGMDKLITAVESLIAAFEAAASSTKGVCETLDALQPPVPAGGEVAGTSSGEPEGLTEEHKEPEGLTEEKKEPEGLTEEPSDGTTSHEGESEMGVDEQPEPEGLTEEHKEPEGLSEEHKDPEGLTEEKKEPAGLTEQPV